MHLLSERFRLVKETKQSTGNTVRSGLSEIAVGKYGVAHVTAQ